MARLPRVDLPNITQHIIQRGNNRQPCFVTKHDHAAYLHWLKEYAEKWQVDIHAWVLMTNHVHILCTPRKAKGVSLLMQSLGRRYVQYFNKTYKRTGTLWEGRFKSCLVQVDNYLLHVYKYIELNPVRAKMVAEPADYTWSSYQINALGKRSALCTPHPLYQALGATAAQRRKSYRYLFKGHQESNLLREVRDSVSKGLALGDAQFKSEIEYLTGRRVTEARRGRPTLAD